MSRAKLFNMIKSRGETPVGRNPFDLGNCHVYTQKAAKIVPVKAFHCMPKDYLEVNMTEFSQNNIPMVTAPFLRGKKENLAYFVPYNTIWHNFNQYQATREDPDSTLLKDKGISYEPRIKMWTLYNAALYFCIGACVYEYYVDLLAVRKAWSSTWGYKPAVGTTISITEYVEYLKSNKIDIWYGVDDAPTIWDYAHKVVLDELDSVIILGDSEFTAPFDTSIGCFEDNVLHQTIYYKDTIQNMFGSFIWCDWCQKLDMLGYGNIYPILYKFKTDFARNCANLLSQDNTKSQVSSTVLKVTDTDGQLKDIVSSIFEGQYMNACVQPVADASDRILNITTYKVDNVTTAYEYVNVYALYAYNKCFYDFMRNTYYDDYSVYNYNCDFIDASSLNGSIIVDEMLPLRFYHLECHQWKKDMFTGVLPDNQLGQVSSVILSGVGSGSVTITGSASLSGTTSLDFGFWHDTGGELISAEPVVTMSNGSLGYNTAHDGRQTIIHNHNVNGSATISSSGSVRNISTSSQLDVLALKRAEAIQQYRQDLMRAGNRTKDIFKQIYGSSPKSELDEAPYFIEVASSDINVNPILATAETGNGNNGHLGDIASRTLIQTDKPLHFKFSTEDFGVIIFLSYIVPESMYNSYRLDPCVTHLDQEAHGLPYFQNLGLQPVIGEYLSNMNKSSVRQRILGYAPPYIERKTDVDLVHGNLVDLFLPGQTGKPDLEYQGSLSHWVVARTDMQQEETVSLRNFYIDPRVLNNVFAFEAGDDYETDHFLTYSSIQINAVRALSELGLPRF